MENDNKCSLPLSKKFILVFDIDSKQCAFPNIALFRILELYAFADDIALIFHIRLFFVIFLFFATNIAQGGTDTVVPTLLLFLPCLLKKFSGG